MKKGIKMDTQFLTDDGRQRAISQLEFLRTVKRAEVAQYLHEAKESGDVIDNAAYEDAKNEQARLEGRIMELERLEYHYSIVGAFEAKPASGLISNESPVGKALLGHKTGDMVIVSTPGGVKEYTIYNIE